MASGASVALLVAIGAVQGATVPPISPSMRALWTRARPRRAPRHRLRVRLRGARAGVHRRPAAGRRARDRLDAAGGDGRCPRRSTPPRRSASPPRPPHGRGGRRRPSSGRAPERSAPRASGRSRSPRRAPRSPSARSRWRSPRSPRSRAPAARSGPLHHRLVDRLARGRARLRGAHVVVAGLAEVPDPQRAARPGRGAAAVRRLADRHGRASCSAPASRSRRSARPPIALLGDAGARRAPRTEAYSWHIVANVVGSSIGAFLAGLLIDHASVDWALAKRLDLMRARACWSAWPAAGR